MKLLFLDIETSPNTAHVWGLWQQNVGLSQLRESSRVMCWAASWKDSDEVYFSSEMSASHKSMIKAAHSLLDEADAVCHYNGKKFDIPTLNKEFLKHGLAPPSPYKQIDLLRVARSQFRFPSNKLDYVADQLGLGKKTAHEGHELWLKCMAGDETAWQKMEEYNINDVILLEKVYNRFLPWIPQHPNLSYFSREHVCPSCGSKHYQHRGTHTNASGSYKRFQCSNKECGKWFTDNNVLIKSDTKLRTKPIN